jgi:hypothetical protein
MFEDKTVLRKYKNGDCDITLYDDGTRVVQGNYLDYPLNIDIRVSTQCSFGQRDDGTFVLCDFCHESAKVNGKHCDFNKLKEKIKDLPPIELAIGCNQFTDDLEEFLTWCKNHFICNITCNSGHLKRDEKKLRAAIDNKIVRGVGVSYRKNIKIPDWILEYENCVVHVIAGIDDIDEIISKDYPKILILGCKDFGYNKGKVNQDKIMDWYRKVHLLFNNQVCFDNLALEQLNIKRFFSDEKWEIINQGEESFYIDAANERIAPSSRSADFVNWDEVSVNEYYRRMKNA